MVSEKEVEAALSAWNNYNNSGPVAEDRSDAMRVALEAAARVRAEANAGEPVVESIESYYRRQIEWSRNTFGPGTRTKGVIDHIRKELAEIEAEPDDLSEWVDVIILAMDGFWRHGGSADDLMSRLLEKQRKNFARKWPDWRTMSPDKAIEHDRSCDARPAPQPSEPVAWGEEIDGKIVSVRLDKSRHCTVPLYPAPQPSGPVEVKPLEWEEARISDNWERFTADSLLGTYETIEWSNGGFGGTFAGGREFFAVSMEEAKAVAQADYERRILSALTAGGGDE